MRTKWAVGTTMVVMALGASATSAQDFEWDGAMERGQFLEIRGISGDIEARLARGARAEVIATKDGRRGDYDDVQIVMFEERGGVVVCAVYGAPRRPNSCDNDHDRDRGNRSIEVQVDFEVRVPEGVEFIGATVSGDVEAEGLRSDVSGSTVSGDVVISTTGLAHASTVRGDLEIEMESLDWRRMEFSTVSGDIDLWLPASTGAQIEFESLSGDFRTSFEFNVTSYDDKFVGTEIEGRIGDGSRRLDLHTVSGDVTLRALDRNR